MIVERTKEFVSNLINPVPLAFAIYSVPIKSPTGHQNRSGFLEFRWLKAMMVFMAVVLVILAPSFQGQIEAFSEHRGQQIPPDHSTQISDRRPSELNSDNVYPSPSLSTLPINYAPVSVTDSLP
ncbi:MAG: hypothetical protein ACRD8Z_14825, partial [Nitrososphaeraceae archaeon]